MRIGLTEVIQGNPLLKTLVKRAGKVLHNVMGPTGDEVTVVWSAATAPDGSTYLYLLLEDVHGRAGSHFSVDDFSDPERLWSRCTAVWEELLELGPKSAPIHPRVTR